MTKTKKKNYFQETEFFNNRFSPLLFVLYNAVTLFISKPGFLLEMDSPFYASFANICKYLSETSFLKYSSTVRINRYAFAICSLCWDYGIRIGTIFAYSHEFVLYKSLCQVKILIFFQKWTQKVYSLPKVSQTLFSFSNLFLIF